MTTNTATTIAAEITMLAAARDFPAPPVALALGGDVELLANVAASSVKNLPPTFVELTH